MTSYNANAVLEQSLSAPRLVQAQDGVLDPACPKAVVKIAPYSGMACGDMLVLSWSGHDAEGVAYQYEISRFVSVMQLDKDIVFSVDGVHVSALDGGSLQIYYTLTSVSRASPAQSLRVRIAVGDPSSELLPAVLSDAAGGALDPDRVPEGTPVTIRPYAGMAAGDQVLLSWEGASPQTSFTDRLSIEAFAVGQALSLWVFPEFIAPARGSVVSIRYGIEQPGREARYSEAVQLSLGPLLRGLLSAPTVLEAEEGWLDLQDSIDGVTIVIDDMGAQEGELVYLKCDGVHFSHRADREISAERVGESLVFIVPYRFWREHQETTVRISYSVERLDEVSQLSSVSEVQIHS